MTTCIVCHKPATCWHRSDPFGKSCTMDPYCAEHMLAPWAHTGFFTDRSPPKVQHFWRCAHHPSAINNFFAGRTECMWDCDAQKLEPHHSGFHPEPRRRPWSPKL